MKGIREKKLLDVLAAIAHEVFKEESTDVIRRTIKRFSIIHLRELANELLQIRIIGNHECRDRNIESLALRSFRQCFGYDFSIETKTVFVVASTFFQAGRFSIGDHEDLLV